jgi:hypothetical protein
VALFSRITEQQAYAEVVLVNEGFRSRQLPAPAYAFWEAHGVVVQAWVLASFMLNDEGPCYCGNLIAPDGQPWFFQVDFGDPATAPGNESTSCRATRGTPCTWAASCATSFEKRGRSTERITVEG